MKVKFRFFIAAAILLGTLPNELRGEVPARQDEQSNGNLIKFVREYVENSKLGRDKSTRVSVANVPGTKLSVAYLQGTTWCGSGGCTVWMIKTMGLSHEVVAKIATAHTPILLLGVKTNDFPEIGVWVQGGGIQKGYEAALTPKGGKYPPSPSTSHRRVSERGSIILIARDSPGEALF